MSLSLACPSCGAKVRAADKAAGRAFKCPKCGDLLRVPPLAPPPQPLQRKTMPQMISVSCPHCTTKLSVEVDAVGSMASCPMCGGGFPLTVGGGVPSPQTEPNLPQCDRLREVEEGEEPESAEQEPEELEPAEQLSEEQVSLRLDDEPWFYGYLEKYAKALKIQGYVIAAVCAVFVTVWVLMFLVGGISALSLIGVSSALASLLCLLGWVLSLVVIAAMLRLWLVGVAAILLAVDAARNIRAMKKAPVVPSIRESDFCVVDLDPSLKR